MSIHATSGVSVSVPQDDLRDTDRSLPLFDASTVARDLYSAGEGRMGTDEGRFVLLLSGRTKAQLTEIAGAYARRYHRTLSQAAKREMSGEMGRLAERILNAEFAADVAYGFERVVYSEKVPESYRFIGELITDGRNRLSDFEFDIRSSLWVKPFHSHKALNLFRRVGRARLDLAYNEAANLFNAGNYEAARSVLVAALEFSTAILQMTSQSLARDIAILRTQYVVASVVRDTTFAIGAGVVTVATAGAAAPAVGVLAAGVVGVGAGTATGAVLRGGSSTAAQLLTEGRVDIRKVAWETLQGAKNGVMDSTLTLVAPGAAAAKQLGKEATKLTVGNFVKGRAIDGALGFAMGAARSALNGEKPKEIFSNAVQSGTTMMVIGGALQGWRASGVTRTLFPSVGRSGWMGNTINFVEHRAIDGFSGAAGGFLSGAIRGEDFHGMKSAAKTGALVSVMAGAFAETLISIFSHHRTEPAAEKPTAERQARDEVFAKYVREEMNRDGRPRVLTYREALRECRGQKVFVLGGYSGLEYEHPEALRKAIENLVREHGPNTVFVMGATADGIGRGYAWIPEVAASATIPNVTTAGIVSRNAAKYGVDSKQKWVVFVDTDVNDWGVLEKGKSLMVSMAKDTGGRMIYFQGGETSRAEIEEGLRRRVPVDIFTGSAFDPNAAKVAKKIGQNPNFIADATAVLVEQHRENRFLTVKRMNQNE